MKNRILLFIFICSSIFTQAQTYQDVAPIFYSRCTSCHNQFGHFPLLNYSQTLPWTPYIQTVLTNGKMPPWSPDTSYKHFLGERLITQAEKNEILLWISNGAQKGDTTQAPPAPVYTNAYKLFGTPDLELSIPTFTSNASSIDSYICFSLPTGLTQDRILKAFEIVPGNPNIVHHVVVGLDTTGTINSDLSGSCYNIPGNFTLGGYAPGSSPTVFPNQGPVKMGMRIKNGSRVILQVHYSPGSFGQVDFTKIRLFFYPAGTTGVREVYATTPLQNWSLSFPPNTVTPFSAVYPSSGGLPIAISVFSAFPHSHKLATTMINYAYQGIDTIPLIRINKWDFNWQGYYTMTHMAKVPAGYKLYSKHIYDNTSNNPDNPFSPPQQVYAGVGTNNEMLFDSFQWLVYQTGDENLDIGAMLANDPLVNGIKESTVQSDIHPYAYPNPFGASVRIGYDLQSSSHVNISIYSMYGVCVKTLLDAGETSGPHELVWDTRNDDGNRMAAGTYFYIITTASGKYTGKLSFMPERN
ncbi:MAG: T9SS type A sorting domain-containing protein [Bacteroidetes bacterium]|nr:T9SS type A sorting domain-containing protein [Bacteroidota bacterium]